MSSTVLTFEMTVQPLMHAYNLTRCSALSGIRIVMQRTPSLLATDDGPLPVLAHGSSVDASTNAHSRSLTSGLQCSRQPSRAHEFRGKGARNVFWLCETCLLWCARMVRAL